MRVNHAAGATAPIVGSRDGNMAGWNAATQCARVRTASVREIHLRARPAAVTGGLEAQAGRMYWDLLSEIHAMGASPTDIVAEKVFLSDIAGQTDSLLSIREEFHGRLRSDGEPLPALTLVQQPPARPGQLCEVQALVMTDPDGHPLPGRRVGGLPIGASGRIVEAGGVRHVFLASVTGGTPGDGHDFAALASSMFHRADGSLDREGLSFRDVVRTWIYVQDIGHDYDELNRVRRMFFQSHGVAPPPASTGIRGTVQPSDRMCGLDLRAVRGEGVRSVAPIRAGTMNEAPSYGADFSRGTRVELDDRVILYISGTASIDTAGRIVARGDIEGQTERMLLNVQTLLAGQGASFADVVSAVTYLKRPDDLMVFGEGCLRLGFPESIPHTICVADICRPDWLCEMEAVAVLT